MINIYIDKQLVKKVKEIKSKSKYNKCYPDDLNILEQLWYMFFSKKVSSYWGEVIIINN